MGRGATEAKSFLERTYGGEDLDIGDAVHSAIKTLKNTFEGELTEKNIEVGWIKTSDPDRAFKVLTQSEIKDLLREVE